ncbi:hypothetical protein [Pseudarthrobacter sp. NamE5]|uniref:hypothetical protein n=1 Tax=Pseudarthrobacter sp. NamE5 TaxID=2576839 RepID=UPI00110BCED0|nr:hypothetical protein [Pseudarthrobacter sp. NamE5]TLM87187.1 hypothetical protein FDW84_05160 [Pseudarthrobacter sp. NamE5]
MDQFAADNEYWSESVEEHQLSNPLSQVLEEIRPLLGGQEGLLCVGGVWLDVTPPPLGPATRSDYPDVYDLVIVTSQLIVSAWGRICGPEKTLDREVTETMGLKNLASIAVDLRPGEIRGDGTVARHHEVTLTFAKGSTFQLPNNEHLSGDGAKRMERLLPHLYSML